MRTKASPLIALPAALLLALSLSACDEDAVSPTSTDSSTSSSDSSSDSSKGSDAQESEDTKGSDDAETTSSSKAGTADPSSTTVAFEDLKAGDCISDFETETQGGEKIATGATVVDCSTPHKYEMVGTGDTTASTFSEANTTKEISKVCKPLLKSYVGSPGKVDNYKTVGLPPSQEAWDGGDRSIMCMAQNADKSPLNNSVKNS